MLGQARVAVFLQCSKVLSPSSRAAACRPPLPAASPRPDRLVPRIARAVREVTPPDGDARVTLRTPIESVDQAAGQLLRLAPGVEVLRPARLRSAIVERLRRAGAAYGLRS